MIPSYVETMGIVILQRHTDQLCFIGSGCTEVLIDHVRNLSSSQELVVFFERVAGRHLLSFGSVSACREAF